MIDRCKAGRTSVLPSSPTPDSSLPVCSLSSLSSSVSSGHVYACETLTAKPQTYPTERVFFNLLTDSMNFLKLQIYVAIRYVSFLKLIDTNLKVTKQYSEDYSRQRVSHNVFSPLRKQIPTAQFLFLFIRIVSMCIVVMHD